MSNDIDDLVNPPPKHHGPVEGVVHRAPGVESEPVHVIVRGLEDEEAPEACAWMPRGDSMPSVDDVCAVVYTDAGTPIVLAWWPDTEWPT